VLLLGHAAVTPSITEQVLGGGGGTSAPKTCARATSRTSHTHPMRVGSPPSKIEMTFWMETASVLADRMGPGKYSTRCYQRAPDKQHSSGRQDDRTDCSAAPLALAVPCLTANQQICFDSSPEGGACIEKGRRGTQNKGGVDDHQIETLLPGDLPSCFLSERLHMRRGF